jgi:hypothetical protein
MTGLRDQNNPHKVIIAQEKNNAGTSSDVALKYSIVLFDPWQLRDALRSWFDTYCNNLKKKPRSMEARTFRERFKIDFDISIPEP